MQDRTDYDRQEIETKDPADDRLDYTRSKPYNNSTGGQISKIF